jgi:acetolactate synthase-1/2/3 large subunit
VVEAMDRPRVDPPEQDPDAGAMQAFLDLLKDAASPVAIVGGAGWNSGAAYYWGQFATRVGLPTAAAFRRQDAIDNDCPVYAGNLGYGPNPKLLERIRNADLIVAVGARLGEATTDGYSLITPDHPGQILVHVHPDPVELNSVYRADLPICAYPHEFAEMAALWDDEVIGFDAGRQAHEEWRAWNAVTPFDTRLDLGPCVAAMQAALPADTIICNGAGNFSGWWHRHWVYGPMTTQLAPTAGAMGYGVPAAVAAARRFPQRTVVALAGDGDFLMNGQELATAAQYGCDLIIILVDNGAYGTIRMHQEREFPARISATALVNPDFAALARAFGGWAATVEATADFAPALAEAKGRKGIRLIHCKTDIERISAGTTITKLHAARG